MMVDLNDLEQELKDATRQARDLQSARSELMGQYTSAVKQYDEAVAELKDKFNMTPDEIPAKKQKMIEAAQTKIAEIKRLNGEAAAIIEPIQEGIQA